MILQQLKQYIEQNGRSRRRDLAIHFGISEDGIDAMLDLWVRKGLIGKELVGCDRQACCQTAQDVWYRCLHKNELPITVMHY